MNNFHIVNVEARIHISSAHTQGGSGVTVGIPSSNFAAISEVKSKLKMMEVKALEQEKASKKRRFVLTVISVCVFGVYYSLTI